MPPFNQIVIYYFSGTGNSKNVARWFSETAARKNIDCASYNISSIDRASVAPPPGALILFVSPVHGFNYPPVMLNFIFRFPKSKNKVVLMNTRAGMLIGNFNVPGISGITFFLSAAILKIKGYSILGLVPVDLPSNWISLHPGLNARTVEFLHKRNKEKVLNCAEKIIAGKKDFRSLREIIQDIIVSPLSVGYYFIGRFFFAKTLFASKDCNDCDICISGCPVKAIIKVDKRPFWTFNCESCMKCIGNCPKRAIETAHGFIIGYLFFASLLTGTIIFYIDPLFLTLENGIVRFILKTTLYLVFLGLVYRIVHYLMRFNWFERVMVYTSLTKYKFWGRRYTALKEF